MRLPDFDYSSNGSYFITICTYKRHRLLSGVSRDIVETELDELPQRFDGVNVDCRMLEPNHLHAVLQLTQSTVTLSRILQAFKSITTHRIKEIVALDHVWQLGYFDHIIRNELEPAAIREYIANNDIVHAVRSGDVF